jgi:hypothetical protein
MSADIRETAPTSTTAEPEAIELPNVIETTVGEVAAELERRGLDPHDRIRVIILSTELIPGRREARRRVIAAGLTDEDIDRLIDEARAEVQALLK